MSNPSIRSNPLMSHPPIWAMPPTRLRCAVRPGWPDLIMRFGASRRTGPSVWFVGSALIPAALISLPLVYVAIRATQAGLTAIGAERFRSRPLLLLVQPIVLAWSVTRSAAHSVGEE